MKTLYVLSGLGADERVFYKINFTGFKVVHIKWLVPQNSEKIENYAGRLTAQITTPTPILIGLSFGGMMAIEVAKHIATEKIILISSAKCRSELPFYFRLAGKLSIHKIIPSHALINANIFTNRFFSNRSREDKNVILNVLRDTEPVFLKWAIACIATWQNKAVPQNIFHIHGSADRILPFKFISSPVKIKGGQHLMILNKASEITDVIKAFIG